MRYGVRSLVRRDSKSRFQPTSGMSVAFHVGRRLRRTLLQVSFMNDDPRPRHDAYMMVHVVHGTGHQYPDKA